MVSKYRIIIPERVYEELNSITVYYEKIQKDLGLKFLKDWELTMLVLKKAPLIFQITRKNLRSIYFKKFPFLIVFEVDENDIIIYKVIHAKRNPIRRHKGY